LCSSGPTAPYNKKTKALTSVSEEVHLFMFYSTAPQVVLTLRVIRLDEAFGSPIIMATKTLSSTERSDYIVE